MIINYLVCIFEGGEYNLSRISNHSEDLNPLNEQKKIDKRSKNMPHSRQFLLFTFPNIVNLLLLKTLFSTHKLNGEVLYKILQVRNFNK